MSSIYKEIIHKIDSFNQILDSKSDLNCIISNLSKQAQYDIDSFSNQQKNGKLYGKTIAIKDVCEARRYYTSNTKI